MRAKYATDFSGKRTARGARERQAEGVRGTSLCGSRGGCRLQRLSSRRPPDVGAAVPHVCAARTKQSSCSCRVRVRRLLESRARVALIPVAAVAASQINYRKGRCLERLTNYAG